MDPPLALSLLGSLELLERPRLSVVGSRKASAYAMHESFALGRALAEAGTVVVSGGAYGCDIAAHHGVLATALQPAPALCVFAGGLQTLYPRGNLPVFQRLLARSGLLCSERLWAAACRPLDFRGRNRIIAGLSRLTVVMQAGARSGALVTAHLALDQGREVAVMRHAEADVRAQGSRSLVQDGAWAFSDAAGLMQGLALAASASPVPAQTVAITLTSC